MNQDERDLMQKEIELEEKWHPLNRVERPDPWDRAICLMSWVLGGLAIVAVFAEVAFHTEWWH